MNQYEKDHLQTLRSSLSECCVLLKKDGAFPLDKPCRIAAYGSGVRHTIKGGTGSGEVNSRYFVTVEQGLLEAGFIITTTDWLDAYDEILTNAHRQFVRDIKKRAKEKHTLAMFEGMGAVMPEPEYKLPLTFGADAAIYVLSRISGEGNDRKVVPGDFCLSETEKRDILALNQRFEKFMLVLNVGGPVDLSPVAEVKNILVLSQLGVETGAALADLLLGKTCPSGKLATTWAKSENYPNVGTFAEPDDTCYKEGIYVGYRWFEAAGKECSYPFGYGLGYTEFEVSVGGVAGGWNGQADENAEDCRNKQENSSEKNAMTAVRAEGSRISVTASVRNIGAFPGKETVQVYLSCPQGKLDKPVKQLAAFAKTRELAPGESQELTVSFDLKDQASYDEQTASYILEQGDYVVRVGTSCADTAAAAVLRLDETVTVRQLKNLLGKPGFTDWKPEKLQNCSEENRKETNQNTEQLPEILLNASDFTTQTISYELKSTIEPAVQKLSDDNLLLMNMGAFNPKGGIASVIGSASMTVAGAAGESAHVFGEPIVMADGPAGVRISAQYYQDEKGAHAYGPALPETMVEFLPWPVSILLGGKPRLPKGALLQEQYCTAIPIGTALAQSWNLDLARTCGDIVGAEMERFGVHLWLAPALNIHRSPLCGRNFEYFSEDPYISGMFAAALTQGVQKHPKRGVTIKHYAANNQETNRYFSNSCVSERAMREIYLKGFEICIRESAPMSVMSSYNLLNGTHTSERRDLCMDILRCEFGFDGVCMTDWVIESMAMGNKGKYTTPDPAKIAAAGGDLFMPGGKNDNARLKKGYEEGRVSRQQLEENVSRVYRMAKEFYR